MVRETRSQTTAATTMQPKTGKGESSSKTTSTKKATSSAAERKRAEVARENPPHMEPQGEDQSPTVRPESPAPTETEGVPEGTRPSGEQGRLYEAEQQGDTTTGASKAPEKEVITGDNGLSQNVNLVREAWGAVQETRETLNRFNELLEERLGTVDRPPSKRMSEPGPSIAKGKGLDPRNWGMIDIPEEEMDEEFQRKRLSEYGRGVRFHTPVESESSDEINKETHRKSNRRSTTPLSTEFEEIISGRKAVQRPDKQTKKKPKLALKSAIRASNQINPGSYLSDAIYPTEKAKAMAWRRRNRKRADDPDGSGDSSDSSNSEEDSDSEEDTGSSDESPEEVTENESETSSSFSSNDGIKKSKRPKTKFKPLAPTTPDKYNGEPSPIKFYRFAEQTRRFCEESGLRTKDQVPKVADYLTGKAYNFYTTLSAVKSQKLRRWGLDKFLMKLFDYCFPPDFRLKQRAKLDTYRQGDMQVQEYAAELMFLFRTVGGSSRRERVDKLWNGLRPKLQRALWLENLDPRTATWKEVIRVAERHEIVDRLEIGGSRRSGDGSFKPKQQSIDKAKETKTTATENQPKKGTRLGKLTEKQKAELSASGKCYNCGEGGHISRNCPLTQTVKSPKKRAPPGAKSFSADIEAELTDDVPESESEAEAIDAFEVACEEFGSSENEVECGTVGLMYTTIIDEDDNDQTNNAVNTNGLGVPDTDQIIWSIAYENAFEPENLPSASRLGDPLAERAMYLLESMVPYPGDDDRRAEEGTRFCVYQTTVHWYIMMDLLTGEDELIPKAWLAKDDFAIGLWYAIRCFLKTGRGERLEPRWLGLCPFYENPWASHIAWTLETSYSLIQLMEMMDYGDEIPPHSRFSVYKDEDEETYYVRDEWLEYQTNLPFDPDYTWCEPINLRKWYQTRVRREWWRRYGCSDILHELHEDNILQLLEDPQTNIEESDSTPLEPHLMSGGLIVDPSSTGTSKVKILQRTAAITKDGSRIVPDPLIVSVKIEGHEARALVDTGSLCDFMSSKLADQLNLKKRELDLPLGVQLAVQGSRSRVNYQVECDFKYQKISEQRQFDIINLSTYDIILGTPFMYQHRASVGFNPARMIIGCHEAVPIEGSNTRKLSSRTAIIQNEEIERAREYLQNCAKPLCKTAAETPLPPLRAINHEIPLIDENKIIPFRRSRCPENFMKQWRDKLDAYQKTRRWEISTARNVVPMLFIPKPSKEPGGEKHLRTVFDLRERNKNTKKLNSPLPDIDGILRRVASHPYRSMLDCKDAYEQIRIRPQDVSRSAFSTPNGNMVSNVIQQGDCNAPATYQALMNHIFSSGIGIFMDVYLDDIIVYSKTLEEHVQHVKLVLAILKHEKIYLSESKLFFLCDEVQILGRRIVGGGIQMDPHKVDELIKWKTPTNRDLLRGFLGVAGYLADDVDRIRIPMGLLHELTSEKIPFRWGPTEQRAFEDVKSQVARCKSHVRRPVQYGESFEPINLVTDASATGIGGLISQGENWRNAPVAAFYSAKLNPAQQNYPVHEVEMLAGVETMLRYRDILLGAHFRWFMDHKGLVTLLNQRELSGRRARWLEKISIFDFEIIYVPGTENILSDALSRLYSNDAPGTERAPSEYTQYDEGRGHQQQPGLEFGHVATTCPILVGTEGASAVYATRLAGGPKRSDGPAETSAEYAKRMKGKITFRGPHEKVGGRQREGQRLTIRIPARKEANIKHRPSESRDSEHVDPDKPKINIDPDKIKVRNDTPAPSTLETFQKVQRANIHESIQGKYENDPYFTEILEKPEQYKNYEITNGLIYINIDGSRLLCIPDALIQGKRIREIIISEAHSLLAHLGHSKTYTYLRTMVWWKNMYKEIVSYCESCVTCKRSKPPNQKPYGLLNPLDIPALPWESIGIDFVGPLPKSKDRDGSYDSITVIIDLLTSMVHLVPSRTNYKAREIAELVFAEVYKHHGLPKSIISDRDTLFTSTFWEELHKLIGTKLCMSSAYHPETDGATERANRTVTQMIRQCVGIDQKDWAQKLPAIEFAINTARSESTGFAPFFLNKGRMPRTLIWDSNEPSSFPGVKRFAERMKIALMRAHDELIANRTKQTRDANRKRRPAPFANGDFVYVSTKNMSIPKGLARKLAPKYIGPYSITKDFGNNSYKVQLPMTLRKRGMHDVFHASLLRIHLPNDDRLFPGRSDDQIFEEKDTKEWAVEKVLTHSGKGVNAVFKILWKTGDESWLPYPQVSHLNALKQYYEAIGATSPKELEQGKGEAPDDPQINIYMMLPEDEGTQSNHMTSTPGIARQMGDLSLANQQPLANTWRKEPGNQYTDSPPTLHLPSPMHTPANSTPCDARLDYVFPNGPMNTNDFTSINPDHVQPIPLGQVPCNLAGYTIVKGSERSQQRPCNQQLFNHAGFLGNLVGAPVRAELGSTNLWVYTDDEYWLLDKYNQVLSISPYQLKECFKFSNLISKNEITQHRVTRLVEPVGYRQVAEILNADPRIGTHLATITSDGEVIKATRDFPLRLDLPNRHEVREAQASQHLVGGDPKYASRVQQLIVDTACGNMKRKRGKGYLEKIKKARMDENDD